jgi:hypothetical protein
MPEASIHEHGEAFFTPYKIGTPKYVLVAPPTLEANKPHLLD